MAYEGYWDYPYPVEKEEHTRLVLRDECDSCDHFVVLTDEKGNRYVGCKAQGIFEEIDAKVRMLLRPDETDDVCREGNSYVVEC